MIIELTRAFLRVKLNDKVIKIHGELLTNGFIAYKEFIENWEPPNDNEEIDSETKELIIKHILEESQKANLGVFFE